MVKEEHHHAAILGIFVCGAIFLLVALYLTAGGSIIWDQKFSEWFAALKHDAWTSIWKTVSVLGDSTVIIILTVVLTAVITLVAGFRNALWLPVGVAVTYGLNLLLKAWFARPRPEFAWGIDVDGYSFPSGNAMLAAALYGLFAVWLWRYGKVRTLVKKIVAWIAVILIVIIGFSRLYFSVHYVTDIIAGYALGSVVMFTAILLSRRRTAKE